MKIFQIRQDDRFAWYETSKEHMEDMVNKCNWQGRVLELAKDGIPAQTGMHSLEWDAVNSAANTANNNFGQWMPERWLQEFVKAYNASIPVQPVQQPAPVAAAQPVGRVWECREDYFLYAKLDDGVAGSGAVKLGDLLYTAAPVAAPVAMPAASVQPDTATEYRNEGFDVVCDRRDLFDFLRAAWREGQDHGGEMDEAERWAKATDHATKAIKGWATLLPAPQLASAQPDSGRDAALEEAAKICESGLIDSPTAYETAAMQKCADAIRELAAHPANVAQVGELSNDKIIDIWKTSMFPDFVIPGQQPFIAFARAILAAAKKGPTT